MKKPAILLLIITFLIYSSLFGQFNLTIAPCQTNEEVIALVDTVLLSNMEAGMIKNIEFTGDPGSVGYFEDGYIFGFDSPSGIVISTGNVNDLQLSNTCSGSNASSNNQGGTDIDLEALSNNYIFDAGVIEFDFKSESDTSIFYYVFGSEEYHEWVGWNFNDVFGFFVNGPGISGQYSNNSENIALIPGTDDPVRVSTINCGNEQNYCTPPPGSSYNCDLLVDNTNPAFGNFYQTSLDAYTVPMSASVSTIPKEWYHIKLAIGDVSDAYYDSGMFLEAGSFSVGIISKVDENKDNTSLIRVVGFPNPASEAYNVEIDYSTECELLISFQNTLGEIVLSKSFNHNPEKGHFKIDISGITPDFYIVKIETDTGISKQLKLIVI